MTQEQLSTYNDSIHKNMTLPHWEEIFLQELKARGKGANTLKNYRTDLNCFKNFLIDVQENIRINFIVDKTVEDYGNYLNKKYNSDNSKRRRVQTLRLFFDFLVKEKVFSENPVRKLASAPKFVDLPRPTTLFDIQKLWQHLCQIEQNLGNAETLEKLVLQRNQIIFLLIFGSGLKVSELSNIKTEHLVLNENPRILINPVKRDPYTVPLSPLIKVLVPQYLNLLEKLKEKFYQKFDDLLFNANPYSILSGGLSPRGIESIFAEFRKKLDIKITAKSLRQATIFKWLHQGHNETLIKEWLGVAPSYSLQPYKSLMNENIYQENFLFETKH